MCTPGTSGKQGYFKSGNPITVSVPGLFAGFFAKAISSGAMALRAPGLSISTTVIATTTTTSTTTTTMCEQFVEENHHPLFCFPQMYHAYMGCRRSKRNSQSALAFEINHEENLLKLVKELREGRYRPGISICFYTRKPKCREIFAAEFRDRIVHHLVYKAIAPCWERVFIHHSYACRPGKGTHAAAETLQNFLRKITINGTHRAYYLKMDIRNFFMSIDRKILFEMLAAKCSPGDLRELLRTIVFHEPTEEYQLQDRQQLRRMLPREKSLFFARPACGLPIGNLTSQFFANVYLNALDQFIKHQLKARLYLRYVDDFILVHRDPDVLHHWHKEITRYLKERLKLSVNRRATRIAPVSGGVDFSGFIIRPHYRLVRRRVVGNLKSKLRMFEEKLVKREGDMVHYYFPREVLERCRATVNSYLGHFRHAQTYSLIQKIYRQYPFLHYYFSLSSRKQVLRDRQLGKVRLLQQQIRWLHRAYQNSLCIIQVGCYYECFHNHAVRLSALTGFEVKKNWRGLSCGCGFPERLLKKVLDRLQRDSVSYIVVRQTGRELYNTRERLPYLSVRYEKRYEEAATVNRLMQQ